MSDPIRDILNRVYYGPERDAARAHDVRRSHPRERSTMKQFSSSQRATHQRLLDTMRSRQTDLETAILNYNHEVAALRETVNQSLEALQAVIDEAHEFLNGIKADAQSYYDDRSEKWQEDDAGSAYQLWLDELDNATEGSVEIDEIEEMSDPDFDVIDNFENVPQGVDE